jgi:hypothetical protein
MRKIPALFSILLLFFGCGHYAWFPPEVNIPPEQKIGLIQFTLKNAEGGLDVFGRPLSRGNHAAQRGASFWDEHSRRSSPMFRTTNSMRRHYEKLGRATVLTLSLRERS